MAVAPPEQTFFKSIRLGLTGSYYKMAQTLGLRRLQELLVLSGFGSTAAACSETSANPTACSYLQGSTNLPSSSSPVHILGQTYANEASQHDTGSLQQEVRPANPSLCKQSQVA